MYESQRTSTALRHLRKAHEAVILWIDALSINQQDSDKRSEQVQPMPLVYRNAAHVWIWLGEEVDDSAYAFENLRWWNSKVDFDEMTSNVTMKDPHDPDRWMADWRIYLPLNERNAMSYGCLIARPWFKRTWIHQEVYLSAGNAHVLCGHASMPWRDFRAAILAISQRTVDPMETNRQWYRTRYDLLNRLGPVRQQTFSGLIAQVRKTKCHDLRDKVFGVLGMLRDDDAWIARCLKRDYTMDVVELYKRVLILLILHNRRLNILESCSPNMSLKPTWAIDWNRPRDTHWMINRQYADLGRLATSVKAESDILQVQAVIEDSITSAQSFDHYRDATSNSDFFSIVKRIHSRFSKTFNHSSDLRGIIYVLSQGSVSDHNYGLRSIEWDHSVAT